DAPQDATPARDPIADLLRQTPQTPPVEPAPAGDPAPAAPSPVTPPVIVTPPPPKIEVAPLVVAEAEDEAEDESEAEEAAAIAEAKEPIVPGVRQRRPIAVVQAIDKVTAETMR